MTAIETFRELLDKYRFTEPITDSAQRFAINSRKRILKGCLKAVDNTSLFYRSAISVYYNLRIVGFKPSLNLSIMLAGLIYFTIVIMLLAGIISMIFNFNRIFDNKLKIVSTKPAAIGQSINEETRKENIIEDMNSIDPTKKNNLKSQASARLGVCQFESSGVKEKDAADISKKIYANLYKLKGSRILYLDQNRDLKNVNRQLIGRISKVGKTYILGLSIVDSQNGKILYSKSIRYNTISADNKIADITDDIIRNAKIWE